MKNLQWFKDRISKRIYRNHYDCCPDCSDVSENGLIVYNKEHAEVLYNTQNDFEAEGRVMNYRDKK